MVTGNHRDMTFKVEIPWELHQALVRIQAEKDLDFEEACKEASMLVDTRRVEFDRVVNDKADRLAKSRFMQQINKARKTIEDQAYQGGYNVGYQKGVDFVRNNEDNFRVSCPVCGKPMLFSNRLSNWEDVRKSLHEVFSKWIHGNCKQQ